MSKWEPCQFIDYEDGRYGLLFEDFGPTQEYLEEREFMGGGYTWHGIVDGLVRTRAPEIAEDLEFDPESSLFVVRSTRREALATVADLIRAAQADEKVLQEGLDNADESILE